MFLSSPKSTNFMTISDKKIIETHYAFIKKFHKKTIDFLKITQNHPSPWLSVVLGLKKPCKAVKNRNEMFLVSCFKGTPHHLFQRDTTFSQRVTASVTIPLVKIPTISNTRILLVHNLIIYCLFYNTFWIEQLNTCTIFNALPPLLSNF